MGSGLKVCYAASEVAPFAKSGGLADVSGALPAALGRQGHDVRVFMPFYRSIHADRYALTRVGFAQDVHVGFPNADYGFSLWTGKQPGTEIDVYFIDCPALYHRDELYTGDEDEPYRFGLFSRAVFESCQRMGWSPDILHCNDWHTGLMPLMRSTTYGWDELFAATKSVLAIHNIGYQGVFPSRWIHELGLGEWLDRFDMFDTPAGRLSFLRTGLIHADALVTVSPTYAREIQTPEHGMGLDDLLRARSDRLVGILNGVDYEIWSPDKDELIPHRYSRRRMEGKAKNKAHLMTSAGLDSEGDPPLVGMITRLVHQKGIELCEQVLPGLLQSRDVRLAVIGTGEQRYEEFFEWLQRRLPGRVAYLRAYDEEAAHLVEAGSDIFLMPSRYEPCGLNQMFSLRYGTIPVVRRTGGLADTVTLFDRKSGQGTGVPFDQYEARALRWALDYALDLYADPLAWKQLIANAMACDFSWKKQARLYAELYRRMRL